MDNKYQSIIDSFGMALNSICFSLALSRALSVEDIKPNILVNNLEKLPPFINQADWKNDPEIFEELVEMLPLAVLTFWMCTIREGFFDLIKKDQSNSDDLESGRMILNIIRNSLGHPDVESNQVKITWNVESKKAQRKYEVKEIGVTLDATNLDGKIFKMDDLGGWGKFIDLLNYLKNSLKEK